MALLKWSELSWEEFVGGLEGYRDYYSGKSREDETYFGCLELMQSRPLQARAEGRGSSASSIGGHAGSPQ